MLHDALHHLAPMGQPLEQRKTAEGLTSTLGQPLDRRLNSVIVERLNSKRAEAVSCTTSSGYALRGARDASTVIYLIHYRCLLNQPVVMDHQAIQKLLLPFHG